ncbi:MAG: DNA mismatch repair protein MutS [Humidesulfovibrio sp.]|uniref:DNA mismatch repair protein MutS n=1 Tax=Humidesulfovibrio sp. TaxID=2910988 RepID=UPI002732A419|nr:DNA mismatch repair protein MutS [Humidesulfovibrio sp.]MDP2847946.1 DNA mismatch repair protein MutS [Humidesulfovibrio sp.]
MTQTAAEGAKLTPMFEQYMQVKAEHPDALLFFRMGDFFELFFEDAQTAARELQITLTTRNPNSESKIPMCGVPHHSVNGYLAQLLEKGYKIAVCDQIEDPRQAKGLVKRAVTRVLTPGTIVEDLSLSAKAHNYLCALYWDADKGAGGLGWVDVSTAEWCGLHSRREPELWQWAMKLSPREIILPQGKKVPTSFQDLAAQVSQMASPSSFDLASATSAVLTSQGAVDLGTLDLADKPELVRALGALLAYLRMTQRTELPPLGEFRPLDLSRHLVLDEVTERNLEIFRRLDGKSGPGTLWHVLDKTATSMGGRLLESRLRQPWRELGPILRTQEVVAFLFERDSLRQELRRILLDVQDLERLSTRIALARATPRDFVAVRESLKRLPGLRALMSDATNQPGVEAPAELKGLLKNWDDMADISDLLTRAFVDSPPLAVTDGGLFLPGFDPALDELISLTEHGEARIQEMLERERDSSGILKLKLGYNKVFGYYLEISHAYQGKVPEHFIRKQTLVNGERYITQELKDLEDRLQGASEERKSLEYKLFGELRETVAQVRTRLMFMAASLAGLDYWQGLAEAARVNDWSRPALHEGIEIEVTQGRHPVVEAATGSAGYIPNDLRIDESRRILLITGPNMAGKSTVLRQAALMSILAQLGSFVPAQSARLGLVDRVFSRVGASDNLARGQSTFMVEMMETARILRQATSRSLVILDEIGRGTSTFDGLALAWAVVEELSRRGRNGIRTLFATHYHELTSLEGRIPGLRNMNIAVREWKGDIVFLRKLIPGPADKSYGIEVARLAGVPQPVVLRAREILASLEEKSQSERGGSQAQIARQSLLPGVPAPQEPKTVEPEHPMLVELKRLDVNGLSPLAALTLLHEWKKNVSAQ